MTTGMAAMQLAVGLTALACLIAVKRTKKGRRDRQSSSDTSWPADSAYDGSGHHQGGDAGDSHSGPSGDSGFGGGGDSGGGDSGGGGGGDGGGD